MPESGSCVFDNTCEAGMICGTAENRVLEWRAAVKVRRDSRKKWLFEVFARFHCHFLRTNSLIPTEHS